MKKFEIPELIIIEFNDQDIVTISDVDIGDDDEVP